MARFALTVSILLAVSLPAVAQRNTAVDLLDSPVKIEGEVYHSGELIFCSNQIPGASLFDADDVNPGVDDRYCFNELFGPFRCWEADPACFFNLTWSTALAGTTQTGMAIPNGDTTKYWAIDAAAATAGEYDYGVGTATGNTITLGGAGLWGGSVIDNNQAGQVFCAVDIVLDTYTCFDLNAGGAVVCSYANADNTGLGAFGNSIGDASAPDACSGATLVQATGKNSEGQVTRVGQYDCTVSDPACTDRWDVSSFSTFINGAEEFSLFGFRSLFVVDNAGSNILILLQTADGCTDCQDNDADMDVLWVNSSQGGADFNVDVDSTHTLSVAMQRTAAGNGKFLHKTWAGAPSASTVVELFDLGCSCFNFLEDPAAVVENNIGKTAIVGASEYFGASVPNPARAPAFLESLLQPEIDLVNLPVGSVWTHQGVHLNAAASSKKGASLSNAITMRMW